MLIDSATLKESIKPKAGSTLNNMRKAELIEYIRCLEHNYNVTVRMDGDSDAKES